MAWRRSYFARGTIMKCCLCFQIFPHGLPESTRISFGYWNENKHNISASVEHEKTKRHKPKDAMLKTCTFWHHTNPSNRPKYCTFQLHIDEFLSIWKVKPRKHHVIRFVDGDGAYVGVSVCVCDDYSYYSLVCQTIVCTWNDFTFTSFVICRGLAVFPTSTRFGRWFRNSITDFNTRCKREDNWHSFRMMMGKYQKTYVTKRNFIGNKSILHTIHIYQWRRRRRRRNNYLTFIKCGAHISCAHIVYLVKLHVNILYIKCKWFVWMQKCKCFVVLLELVVYHIYMNGWE